jgi:hypothetical protein
MYRCWIVIAVALVAACKEQRVADRAPTGVSPGEAAGEPVGPEPGATVAPAAAPAAPIDAAFAEPTSELTLADLEPSTMSFQECSKPMSSKQLCACLTQTAQEHTDQEYECTMGWHPKTGQWSIAAVSNEPDGFFVLVRHQDGKVMATGAAREVWAHGANVEYYRVDSLEARVIDGIHLVEIIGGFTRHDEEEPPPSELPRDVTICRHDGAGDQACVHLDSSVEYVLHDSGILEVEASDVRPAPGRYNLLAPAR